MIDNFAHGIGDQELSYEAFRELVNENQKIVDEALEVSLKLFQD